MELTAEKYLLPDEEKNNLNNNEFFVSLIVLRFDILNNNARLSSRNERLDLRIRMGLISSKVNEQESVVKCQKDISWATSI
jgi:hypothetical protein